MLHVWKTYVSTVNTITLKKNFDLDIQNKEEAARFSQKRKKEKKREAAQVESFGLILPFSILISIIGTI